MKRRFGLVMAMMMVVSAISPIAYAFTNPLKNYNLYDDVNPQSNDEREQVMSEVLMNNRSNSSSPEASLEDPYANPNFGQNIEPPKSRNQTLRESSRNVYADPEDVPEWLELRRWNSAH